MKKTKETRKAIHAELRKESKSFQGWLKYEVTIKNPDGTLDIVPAYGKDLQDALSRVVHDDKIKRILPKISRVPLAVWVICWFGILAYITVQVNKYHVELGDWIGLIYTSTVGLLTIATIAISNWFSLRNKDKK